MTKWSREERKGEGEEEGGRRRGNGRREEMAREDLLCV